MSDGVDLKKEAARHALSLITSGMTLGLGSGSTVAHLVEMLGEQVRTGQLTGIRGVPTSRRTAEQAQATGIQLVTLEKLAAEQSGAKPDCSESLLDLALDGADEVDPHLDLIKGLGRALLREKIVEQYARRFVVIADESKLVPRLGTKGPLPVEIVPFEAALHVRWLNTLDCRAELWLEADGSPVVTDNGNWLARCWFERGITDPHCLARVLVERPGVVEHGLFLNMADAVIVAGVGGVRSLERRPARG